MDSQNDADGLFYLAEQERDEATWAAIAAQYHHLMIAWAMGCPATAISGESPEVIADQALKRAWLALATKRVAAFPNCAAFLDYLRVCVIHTAIDAARVQAAQAHPPQFPGAQLSPKPVQVFLDQLDRAEMWRVLNALIITEQERVVLLERYVLDIPPRHILTRHPALFADLAAVYRAVRNLCDHLERHAQLRQLGEAYVAP